jgi:hypothetical protein
MSSKWAKRFPVGFSAVHLVDAIVLPRLRRAIG